MILTTDAAPMNEFGAPFSVASVAQRKNNFGVLHSVDPAAIRERVPTMLAQPHHVIAKMQMEARMRFEKSNREFGERFRPFLDERPRVEVNSKAKLAILGNFDAEFSTENDLLWTLRDMGHVVVPFQENRDTTDSIYRACDDIDLLIYVHTHGWETPGTFSVGRCWVS